MTFYWLLVVSGHSPASLSDPQVQTIFVAVDGLAFGGTGGVSFNELWPWLPTKILHLWFFFPHLSVRM